MALEIDALAQRLEDGLAIEEEAAAALLASTDLLELGRLASVARVGANGHCNLINARRIVYSNVCRSQCPHCAWGKAPDAEDAFTRSPEEIVELAALAVEAGIDQIQLVGGVDSGLAYDYYLSIVAAVRQAFSGVHIQAFAPAQLGSISANAQVGYERIFEDLRGAGLDSVREDAADVFDPRIRQMLCYGKVSGGIWLQVMREAHEAGLSGGASMLYGPCEGPGQKAGHLSHLRDLQEDTGGFTFFAPRAFRPNGSKVQGSFIVGGSQMLRDYAVGAIFLTDIPHIRCYADDLGMEMAQTALHFGVDTIAVLVRDDEPLDDGARAAQQLPNIVQLTGLVEEAGFHARRAGLDQM